MMELRFTNFTFLDSHRTLLFRNNTISDEKEDIHNCDIENE